jgi:hypothetical protein
MKIRTAYGLGLLTASVAFFALGTLILTSAIDEKARTERQRESTDRQCLSILRSIPGAEVTDSGDVSVLVKNVTDPRKAIDDLTTAVLVCPSRRLVDPCIGDRCQGSQDKVIMRFKLRKTS